jgi:ribonuclease-3
MIDPARFVPFEERTSVTFVDKSLLIQAFTHRSYINEHRSIDVGHNERLEFLGDAVLELVITEYLYRKYPDRPEGELTSFRSALVNTTSLSATAMRLGMNEFLLLSRGEAKDTGRARQYILANTFEAVIGATYLDQGYETAKRFIGEYLFPQIDAIVADNLWQDSKSRFQERAQEVVSVTPIYRTIREVGPDHDKHFTVAVYLGEGEIASGEGKSKQEAEQAAARNALEKKGW